MQEAPIEQVGRSASVWKTPYAKQEFMNVAVSALIGGILLVLVSRVIVPYEYKQDTALLSFVAITFNVSIQYGGYALLLAALLCYLSVPYALLYDAVVTALIGAAWIISCGTLVVLGKGFWDDILFIAIGMYFLFVARQNLVAHRRITRLEISSDMAGGMRENLEQWAPQPVDADQAASRAEALKRVISQKADARTAEKSSSSSAGAARSIEPSTPAPERVDVSQVDEGKEPPPSGFLADLGKDEAS